MEDEPLASVGGANVQFYPVLHLLTGPPSLTRNGGIWKKIKRDLAQMPGTPRVMVQALHFTSYGLSPKAWEDWFREQPEGTTLSRDLERVFGKDRDVFVDSGGFQLLQQDKIDLSKWGLEVDRDAILDLQKKYNPQRFASLDAPVSPKTPLNKAAEARRFSLENAKWLLEHRDELDGRPFLCVHGRTHDEVRDYLKRLDQIIDRKAWRDEHFGIALGSQVPLTHEPGEIIRNAGEVLGWMDKRFGPDVPFHVFGIGEPVMGEITRSYQTTRPLSLDNSTWVQSAFRLKAYDSQEKGYVPFSPTDGRIEGGPAAASFETIGAEAAVEVLSRPAYDPVYTDGGVKINRSDVLASLALHNLGHWRSRLEQRPARLEKRVKVNQESVTSFTYDFPVSSYKPGGETLVLLSCSKGRPYRESPSQKRVINRLAKNGLDEGEDYDRITLSGLHGPVHWRHEGLPQIKSYDFQLTPHVKDSHRDLLRIRTADVLRVIRKKYRKLAVYLPSKAYGQVFTPTIQRFDASLASSVDEIADLVTA